MTVVGEIAAAIKLMKDIVKAAVTARKSKRVCRKFARWLKMIESLLKPLLKIPNLVEHPETSKPLKQLEESLKQAYQLVIKYKDRSYPYRFIMGSVIVKRFRDARDEIKESIDLIPLIKLFVSETIRPVGTLYQDKEEGQKMGNNRNKEQMDQKKGKNKKDGGRDKDKYTEKGKNRKEGKEENKKVKEKGRRDMEDKEKRMVRKKDTEKKMDKERKGNEKEKGRDREKYMKERNREKGKENGREDIRKGNNKNEKNAKKEVELINYRGRGRDDHQLLDKTEDSKSNKNKKRVMPMIPATVVLKVGGAGLRCGCNGCVDKICNKLFQIRGVQQVVVDMEKNEVIVTGTTMDMKTLLEKLSMKVRRPVEVMQPKMMDGKD